MTLYESYAGQKEDRKNNMFLNYINNFRGITILFIVVFHCLHAFQWDRTGYTYKFFQFLLVEGTVLFVFISGYLFQHLSAKYELKNYLNKKFKNVLLPYIIISFPAIIIFTVFLKVPEWGCVNKSFYTYPVIIQGILFYLRGTHLPHLWFIPMITVYYFISPLLIKLDRNQKGYLFLPILFLISLLVGRNNASTLQSFIHFFSVYLFGMCCSRYKNKISTLTSNYCSLILFAIMYILLLCCYYFLNFNYFKIINLSNQLIVAFHPDMIIIFVSKIVACILLMVFLKKFDHIIKTRFDYLASISFGIYFVHYYVIALLKYLLYGIAHGPMPVEGTPLLLILFFIGVVICSSLSIFIAKKLLGRNSRLVLGC